MDKIFIKRLLVRGIIGINPDERDKPQDVLITIELSIDLHEAGQTDNIAHSINYRTIVKHVMAHAETIARFTVEAFAEDIARICLDYNGVQKAIVRIEKPAAARFAESVGVEIERSRI